MGNVVDEYKAWTVTPMVARWVSHPRESYGLIINSDSSASDGSCRYFRSSSHGDLSQRPHLVVTCGTSRGQNLYWEDVAFLMEREPWFAEQYIAQSSEEPGGPWANETSLVASRWWHSGNMGSTKKRFFRFQAGE